MTNPVKTDKINIPLEMTILNNIALNEKKLSTHRNDKYIFNYGTDFRLKHCGLSQGPQVLNPKILCIRLTQESVFMAKSQIINFDVV